MRRVLAFLVLLLGALAAGQAPPSPADLAAIDAFVADRMRAHAIPGVSLAITYGGEVVHARGFGSDGNGRPLTADTPLYVGSVSKAFTGLAVMQRVDDGRLELVARAVGPRGGVCTLRACTSTWRPPAPITGPRRKAGACSCATYPKSSRTGGPRPTAGRSRSASSTCAS